MSRFAEARAPLPPFGHPLPQAGEGKQIHASPSREKGTVGGTWCVLHHRRHHNFHLPRRVGQLRLHRGTGRGIACHHPRIPRTVHAGKIVDIGQKNLCAQNAGFVAACLRQQGIDVRGPYPADTLFQPFLLKDADAVLAMYHDQGLPVLKFASFGNGVNITLGLPFIRTSVDHGTALDLAASGRADAGSLKVALETALQMVTAQAR